MNCTESSQTEEKCKHRLDIPQCNSPEMNDVSKIVKLSLTVKFYYQFFFCFSSYTKSS